VPGKDSGRRAAPERRVCGELKNGLQPGLWVTWWSYPGAAKTKHNKAASGKETGTLRIMFTGTLIEDLIATVERAEAKSSELDAAEIEPWFASVHETTDYDSKLLGVA
jgi:hypothetical protein